MITAILLISDISAYIGTGDILVCGHAPDSKLGFGEVKIGNLTVTCDNVIDGFCPEMFQDAYSNIIANCSSCIDPDCRGTLTGFVKDITSTPIERVLVTASPIRWNITAPSMEKTAYTFTDGHYPSAYGDYNITMNIPTGNYYFSAGKDGYDTEVKEATVLLNKETNLDFALLNGTCHEDCTDSYGRCNAGCEGTTFADKTTVCRFYDSKVKSLCNHLLKGTSVIYDDSASEASATALFITCCDGKAGPVTRYYTKANVDYANIKDLVKVEKVARYDARPVRVVVAYWSKTE